MNVRISDVDLLEMLALEEAREDFWAYRQYINGPKMKLGWWQREVADVLMQFYDELLAGKRPKYIIEAPPQHGKSVQIVDFLSWVAGKHPELRAIYTSFSERLGVRANLRMQRIMDGPKYKKLFPGTVLGSSGATGTGATRNRELLEYQGQEGYFRNTTVRGSITGEGLDLGVMDDPIKGREQAGSQVVRDATWDWFTDDFFSRFSEEAGFLGILTRWHKDDPVGRLVEKDDTVKVFKYPALATKDEKHRKQGEALFPEHKSVEFIEERRKVMSSSNFLALYQQNPTDPDGEIIRSSWFKRYRVLPKLQWRKIYVDTAQKTKERNDYSVFEVWGLGVDNNAYLVDLLRGKWEAPDLRVKARDFWSKHLAMNGEQMGQLRQMVVEDKSSGTGLIQDLRTMSRPIIPVAGKERNKDKFLRANDGTPYIQGGYVWIPEEAPWLSAFTQECDEFTSDDSHLHDDQIDPMLDAIEEMLSGLGSIKIWEDII